MNPRAVRLLLVVSAFLAGLVLCFTVILLVSGRGGMRLESWRRLSDVGLAPFWRFEIGNYVILGIVSLDRRAVEGRKPAASMCGSCYK